MSNASLIAILKAIISWGMNGYLQIRLSYKFVLKLRRKNWPALLDWIKIKSPSSLLQEAEMLLKSKLSVTFSLRLWAVYLIVQENKMWFLSTIKNSSPNTPLIHSYPGLLQWPFIVILNLTSWDEGSWKSTDSTVGKPNMVSGMAFEKDSAVSCRAAEPQVCSKMEKS